MIVSQETALNLLKIYAVLNVFCLFVFLWHFFLSLVGKKQLTKILCFKSCHGS